MHTSASIRASDLRGYPVVWRVLASLVILLCAWGALVTLGGLRFVVTLLTVTAFGAVYGFALGPDLPRVRRPMLSAALLSCGAAMVLVGTPGAAHGWGLLTAALLIASSPPVLKTVTTRRTGKPTRRTGGSGAPVAPAGLDGPDGLDVLLRLCDDDQLLAAWYASEGRLRGATTVTETMRVVTMRQLCLDELERRSPEAFGRWLALQSLDH